MIKGIGASIAAMKWEQTRSEIIADNVANVDTIGFKRSMAVGSEFGALMMKRLGDLEGSREPGAPDVGLVGQGAVLEKVVVDDTRGVISRTDRELDVALIGPGEFIYQHPNGLGYTRNGAFDRDEQGQLVTAQGYPVLVNGAPVGVLGQTLSIEEDGSVRVADQPAGRLDIRGADGTKVVVRQLELSNVDRAQEMTDLITSLRSYQVNQRIFQMQDQTLARAVTELGKV